MGRRLDSSRASISLGVVALLARKNTARQRGAALLSICTVLTIVAIATTAYVNRATQTIRIARANEVDVRLSNVCEAGIQDLLISIWKPFKNAQKFDDLDSALTGASSNEPKATTSGVAYSRNKYSAGVVGFVPTDSYNRLVSARVVSWDDINNNGQIDSGEPRKVVDVSTVFSLTRSQVFDYTYFVNNYGWMTGFGPTQLIVNGDMRANGNFDFSGGTPTINGSVFASPNSRLSPAAEGLVNITPNQYSNSQYQSSATARWRQSYDQNRHGAKGSEEYEKWRDFIYDQQGQIVNNKLSGSVVGDVRGFKTYSGTLLDSTPATSVTMPDLSDISNYMSLSASYVDNRQTFEDGTPNPDYGLGAYVKVWNSVTGEYVRIDTNGVLSGSAALVGSSSKPILVHGPVTFTHDCVITGFVQGQGTIYTGRNVHIVGSITYKNPPDFRGNDPQQINNANSKKDLLALAARGSVIIGNVSQFSFPYPLTYMTPPFTKGRWDDFGNWIPPFNAVEIDYTGRQRYKSTMPDATLAGLSSPVNNIDAILYTNYLGGGQLGVGGGGVTFNGSLVSKDEAMVIYSLPMRLNYDHRIRERFISKQPLIDMNLPRAPALLRSTWQDRGTKYG